MGFSVRRFPRPFNRAIIAPYFADSDLRTQTLSRVYYQQYFEYQNSPLAKEIIKNATDDVNQFQKVVANDPDNSQFGIFRDNVANFTANHVIVITWYKLVAYPYSYYWNRPPREVCLLY